MDSNGHIQQSKSQDIQSPTKLKLQELRIRRKQAISHRYLFALISVIFYVLLLVFWSMGFYGPASRLILVSLLLYGLFFACLSVSRPVRQLELEIQLLENDLELQQLKGSLIELRAESQFRRHEVELNKYYTQTLGHSRLIFVVGILFMVAGFCVIVGTLYLVFLPNPARPFSEVVALTLLGAIGGVLSDFVAVMYLRMYSETVKALTQFHNRLVSTHHLHLCNLLAAKITDKRLREKTLSTMAVSLCGRSDTVSQSA